MAPQSFKDRLAAMRSNIEGARQNLAEGGSYVDVPAGIYVGCLVNVTAEFNQKSGAPTMIQKFHITTGDYKGKTTRDFQHMENDVGLAICTEFLRDQGFDATPDDIFDLAKSEVQKTLVFSDDFLSALEDISNSQPPCQFRVWKENSPDGQRIFSHARAIEWIKGAPSGSGTSPASGSAPAPAQPEAPAAAAQAAPPPPPETPEQVQLRELALKLGLEVTDAMTIDQVKETFAGFEFPLVGVPKAQLLEKNYAEEDITDDAFISQEQADVLSANGLGEIVLLPDPRFAEPAPAAAPPRRMMRRK